MGNLENLDSEGPEYNHILILLSLTDEQVNKGDIFKKKEYSLIRFTEFFKQIKREYDKNDDVKKEIDRIFNKDNTNDINNIKNYNLFKNDAHIDYIFNKLKLNKPSASEYGYGYGYSSSQKLVDPAKKISKIEKYYKYFYIKNKFNKENIPTQEAEKIITFHNILFVLQEYYLKDNTIILQKGEGEDKPKKYYVKNLEIIGENLSVNFLEINKLQKKNKIYLKT